MDDNTQTTDDIVTTPEAEELVPHIGDDLPSFFEDPEGDALGVGEADGVPGDGEGGDGDGDNGGEDGDKPVELTYEKAADIEYEGEAGVKFKVGDAVEMYEAVAATVTPFLHEGETPDEGILRVVENGYNYLTALSEMAKDPEVAIQQINGLVAQLEKIHADKFDSSKIDLGLLTPDNLSEVELALKAQNAVKDRKIDELSAQLETQKRHYEGRLGQLKPQIDAVTKQNLLEQVAKQIETEYNKKVSTAELGEILAKDGSDDPLKAWLATQMREANKPVTTKAKGIPEKGDKVIDAKANKLTADQILDYARRGYTIK